MNLEEFSFEKFSSRHIGPRKFQKNLMAKSIGVNSVDSLIEQTIPSDILKPNEMKSWPAMSEASYLAKVKQIALKNKVYRSYIGQGYYGTNSPSVIIRNILENPGWYTQYTPYQAEISQGRLEALLIFQTMISDLTKLPVANASLLDEATAAAEAMAMFFRARKKEKKEATTILLDSALFKQTIDVIKTRSEPLGIQIKFTDNALEDLEDSQNIFAYISQYPAMNGDVKNLEQIIAKAKENNVYTALACDLLALMLLKSPGELAVDCAFGNSQRFGVPMGFGGPHAAFFSVEEHFKRDIPGRIIGVSKDRNGKIAYRMSLQTREQHIRREKATSNICTAQALLAIMAGMYAVYHGPKGLKRISQRVHNYTSILYTLLKGDGFSIENELFFDTLTILNYNKIVELKNRSEKRHINLHFYENKVSVSLDETIELQDLIDLYFVFTEKEISIEQIKKLAVVSPLEKCLLRTDEVLTHTTFHNYHSESDMMRYLKNLEKRDLSLTSSMIPLGSCTMKLNAASEMLPITWREYSSIHPFVPENQSQGYKQIIEELSGYLAKITNLPGVSMQPNSGAQGEFAGMLTIRNYLISLKQAHRDIVLIPSSAHGTNPASGVMAGFKIVVVKCDAQGNIDRNDLTAKVKKHTENLAGLMITYPSTHGVFEEGVKEICKLIHDNNGLVYMDGANLNAQVGLTSPGLIGGDVCHINLHKTFAIPHGGGGPGMGPICVTEKLIPFLPGHIELKDNVANGAVSSAPYGSSNILLISHAYISMMGSEGLKEATKIAILNANYIAARIKHRFPVLYTGTNGKVAHECIVDFREDTKETKITVEDIAKRLMDYGFHAPTMSWPVAGTMMIEPTESESQEELDRFCDAMLKIGDEIDTIKSGKSDVHDNALKFAPHTAEDIASNIWEHSYSREEAAFPLAYIRENKFWPYVTRIDNAYGDRNLICSCPTPESYN